MKSLLAALLGLGFLALEARAQAAAPAPKKPVVAFLGLAGGSDPQVADAIATRIRRELAVDSFLVSVPDEEVGKLFAKGILRGPGDRPADPEALKREVGEAYFAFGILERVTVDAKRKWWKPWSVKSTWAQGMRLRVVEGVQGPVIFDGVVAAAAKPESRLLFAPEGDWGKLPPLERDKRLRMMAEAVSVESAKALAKAVRERAAPPADSGTAPATPG